MVGRTPEFLGKKIEAYEMKMACWSSSPWPSASCFSRPWRPPHKPARPGPLNGGPHGFSEILYAFSSQTGNNGSAFAGLTGNTALLQHHGPFAMIAGRYAMTVPILAIGRLDGRQAASGFHRWAPSNHRRSGSGC